MIQKWQRQQKPSRSRTCIPTVRSGRCQSADSGNDCRQRSPNLSDTRRPHGRRRYSTRLTRPAFRRRSIVGMDRPPPEDSMMNPVTRSVSSSGLGGDVRMVPTLMRRKATGDQEVSWLSGSHQTWGMGILVRGNNLKPTMADTRAPCFPRRTCQRTATSLSKIRITKRSGKSPRPATPL